MRIIRFGILTCAILWCTSAHCQEWKKSMILDRQIEIFLNPLIKHDLFMGSILIAQDDQILFNKSYGYANCEHSIKNESTTVFRIASLSKPFTKLAIIQLIEKQKLSYNTKLSEFLSDYPNAHLITVKHLLEHSSGIPHLNDFIEYDSFAKEPYEVEEVIGLFRDAPLDYAPGSQKGYSNSGYVLLAYIIEQVSQLGYHDYLEKHIFKKAQMTNSGHDSGDRIIDNLASGYMMNLKGKGLQLPLYYNPSIKIGGGSLYSTVEDLFNFYKAYRDKKLSTTNAPLYNQGIYGKSPGYNASIWHFDNYFIAVLGNNYSTPIRNVAKELSNLILGKDFKIFEINEEVSRDVNELKEYVRNYKIEEYIESIEYVNGILIEYEDGDKQRGCRLIPIEKDHFYDTCYMEKVMFIRNEKDEIIAFEWESGDRANKF